MLCIDYRSLRSSLALNNLKNKCQNFKKIFFSKKYFLQSEQENLEEYLRKWRRCIQKLKP
jgi:hypothetical protein